MFVSRDFSFSGVHENDSQAHEAYLARVAIGLCQDFVVSPGRADFPGSSID